MLKVDILIRWRIFKIVVEFVKYIFNRRESEIIEGLIYISNIVFVGCLVVV